MGALKINEVAMKSESFTEDLPLFLILSSLIFLDIFLRQNDSTNIEQSRTHFREDL